MHKFKTRSRSGLNVNIRAELIQLAVVDVFDLDIAGLDFMTFSCTVTMLHFAMLHNFEMNNNIYRRYCNVCSLLYFAILEKL